MNRTALIAALVAATPRLSALGRRTWTWSRSKVLTKINGQPVWQLAAEGVFPASFPSAETDEDAALADVCLREAGVEVGAGEEAPDEADIADIAKSVFTTHTNHVKHWRYPNRAKAAELAVAFDKDAFAASRGVCGPYQCIEVGIRAHGKPDLVPRLEALRDWLKGTGLKVESRQIAGKLAHLALIDRVRTDSAEGA